MIQNIIACLHSIRTSVDRPILTPSGECCVCTVTLQEKAHFYLISSCPGSHAPRWLLSKVSFISSPAQCQVLVKSHQPEPLPLLAQQPQTIAHPWHCSVWGNRTPRPAWTHGLHHSGQVIRGCMLMNMHKGAESELCTWGKIMHILIIQHLAVQPHFVHLASCMSFPRRLVGFVSLQRKRKLYKSLLCLHQALRVKPTSNPKPQPKEGECHIPTGTCLHQRQWIHPLTRLKCLTTKSHFQLLINLPRIN